MGFGKPLHAFGARDAVLGALLFAVLLESPEVVAHVSHGYLQKRMPQIRTRRPRLMRFAGR